MSTAHASTGQISGCAVIGGPPGSGKTRELLRRIEAAKLPSERIVKASPHPLAARRLGGGTLADLAFAILREHPFESGLRVDPGRIDDVDAEEHFERAASSLFSLEWVELLEPELGDAPSLDYEIAGLRAPERFAQAAYRLIRKLRSAGILPERFLEIALRKATEWYAKPPNLAHPELLLATAERYRDSLNVDGKELDRQRRREVDLAKILAKTYETYVADAEERGCLTDVDAIAEATKLCESRPEVASRTRELFPLAFVDDAQDLTVGELALLRAVYGSTLDGVTFAGDPDQATRTFSGARPERVFACATPLELPAPEGARGALVAFASSFLRDRRVDADPKDLVRVRRVPDQNAEAAFVAERVLEALAAGTPPESLAILVRTMRGAHRYVGALLDRNVAVRPLGDIDLLDEPSVQDALGLLWSVHDPFRHDWLLRALATPVLRFSDATLATLCAEPAQPQAALFAEIDESSEAERSGRRWDRERDLRLGRNVTRGDRDPDLESEARSRLVAFRELRCRWDGYFRRGEALEDAARAVIVEGRLFDHQAGETEARTAYRRGMLERFLARLAAYAIRDRTRTLGDALRYLETIAASEWAHCGDEAPEEPGVHVASIEAVKGSFYAEVFVPNLRAGAFPPYWVPDAFVFTTLWGIVPKDNVGEARAARTAKFTWYMHNAKIRDHYGNEDRRLLYSAMTRATERVTLTAWGNASKGVAAPELLAELEAALARVR